VASSVGVGSIFTIWFPMHREEAVRPASTV
jgi:hypothetical protein